MPLLFTVAGRIVLDTAMLRSLRRVLPLTSVPDGTVGWQKPGLDVVVRELRVSQEAAGRRPAHRRTPDRGRTDNSETAEDLALMPTTVKSHLQTAMCKPGPETGWRASAAPRIDLIR